jgi:hypothetical protein
VLLTFRQTAAAGTQRVALRNVPPGRVFTLRAAPDDRVVGTYTSAQLNAGIDVTVPAQGAAVWSITPGGAVAAPPAHLPATL